MVRHQSKHTGDQTYLKHDEVKNIEEFHKKSTEYLMAVAEMLNERKMSNKSVAGLNNTRNLVRKISLFYRI